MYFCDIKEVTLSPQGWNSRFCKIVAPLKLLLCEMNKNPSYQLTITPNFWLKLSLPY